MQKTAAAGYDADFALWAESQAAALREGRFDDVDIENVSEEIESLGRSDRRELRSRLTVLVLHVLKLLYQPQLASGSWRATIAEQAREIRVLIEESPSLERLMPELDSSTYRDARKDAALETGLPIANIPETPTPEFDRAAARALGGEDFEL
jgi:hypothetical protein